MYDDWPSTVQCHLVEDKINGMYFNANIFGINDLLNV